MKKTTFGILLFLIICSLGWNYYNWVNLPIIGYVDSNELIYGFEGTKSVQVKLEKQKKQIENNIDTLNFDLQKAILRYETDFPNLSIEKAQQRKQAILSQKENTLRYIESLEDKIAGEENEMMEGALNQINSYSLDFGEEKGVSIIFGTTQYGNVVYGEQSINMTKELLNYMNTQYIDEIK